ncbi:MAG: protein translocase subunit SecF [bacterium]|nr:protein translocase subunit SecF [bacterium]
MRIIPNRKLFYIFSGILVGGGFVMFLIFGLRLGIDFTGGSLLEIEFVGERPSLGEIHERLSPLGLGQVIAQPTGERGMFIRTKDISEETHQEILGALAGSETEEEVLRELRFESIGPTIGKELKRKSVYSIFTVLVLIILYIAWAFRKVSKPVSSWKYGVVAIVALFHDVGIPLGVFSVLGLWGVEVDTLFITALLTVLGFSVHDTIVVFDRIRENLASAKRGELFEDMVERSIHQTFGRSLNTSLTVLLSLLAVFFFGGESVRYFSLALMIGVVFGTYSSIFIASPLLVTWHYFSQRKNVLS